MELEEEWRAVVGYEGSYEVSSLGRVKSLKRVLMRSDGKPYPIAERILKPLKNGKGVWQVKLHKNNEQKNYIVSNLVAYSFLGPRPQGMHVLHGAKGRDYHGIDNLSYGTAEQNNGPDKVRDGTINRGERQWLSKLTKEDVLEIRELLEEGTLTHTEIAARFNVHKNNISQIKTKRTWAWM